MGKALIIIVLGFSTIFGSVMFTITANQQRSSQRIVRLYEDQLAQNAVESATNVAISSLYRNWGTSGFSGSFGGASYSVSVTDATGDSTTEAKRFLVTTISNYQNSSDTTYAIFIQPAYSYYQLYSKQWPSHEVYSTGDTIVGPVHSNEKIKISGSPVFLSKFSLKDNSYTDAGGADPQFLGGAELGSGTIFEPNLQAVRDSAQAGGDVYNENVWINFLGTSYTCSTASISPPISKNIADYNHTIVTINDKDIHVKGTVDGEITLVSDQDIYIEGPLTYAVNPLTNPNSDDYLGLAAVQDIWLVDNAANSGNVDIHAALLCKRDVIIEDYDNLVIRGTLTILGSIVRENTTPYGQYVGGVRVSGYAFNHVYDWRLMDHVPPYFPRVSRLEQIYRSN